MLKRLTLAAMLWVGATSALAHDWYPRECCSGQDCAPVISSRWVAGARYDATGHEVTNPTPMEEVTTEKGTVIVPPNMPHRPSQDNRRHACIGRDTTSYYLICIFDPPGF